MKQTTIIFLLLFASCTTVRKAEKTLDKKPLERAKYCATNYPIKESVVTNTVYKEGEPVLVKGETEYITVNCDSIIKATPTDKPKQTIVRIPVPVYVRVDTFSTNTTKTQEDSAKLAVLQGANDNLKEQLSDCTDKVDKITADRNRYRSIVIWGSLVLLVILLATLAIWYVKRKARILSVAKGLVG